MMLVHIGQPDVAENVHNAWLSTLEDGVHTYDIYDPAVSKEKVGTKEFAQAVVARLGRRPQKLKAVSYAAAPRSSAGAPPPPAVRSNAKRELRGVDVYVNWESRDSDALAAKLDTALVEKERAILTEQARKEGKPDNIIEKMIEGRMRNFYAEHVLAEQPFVKDDKQTVGKVAQAGGMKLVKFIRWHLGETSGAAESAA